MQYLQLAVVNTAEPYTGCTILMLLMVCSGKKSASIDDRFWEHPNPPTVTTIDVSRNQLTSFPEKYSTLFTSHTLMLHM